VPRIPGPIPDQDTIENTYGALVSIRLGLNELNYFLWVVGIMFSYLMVLEGSFPCRLLAH
jgi:hypothetical protein